MDEVRWASGYGLQRRLESTSLGRVLLSAFIAVTLFCVFVTNLPDSELRGRASPISDRYLTATGLDQNWGVFAPDPRREVIALEARIAYAGGDKRVWRPPESGALIGAYRDYRWRKFVENAISPSNRDELWRSTALFAARAERGSDTGRRRARVSLVYRFYELRPPGRDPDRGPWREIAYHEQEVRPQVAGGAAR